MQASRAVVDRIVAGGDAAPAVYGVNTGFGALAEVRISADQVTRLQQNLVRSHAAGVHPVIPARGSVGASGDLAPLAHLALGMIGEGQAELGGEVMPAREALRRAGIAPLV